MLNVNVECPISLGWPPLPLKLSLSLRLIIHDPMLSLSPSLSMHEPLLSLSMLVLDPNHPLSVTFIDDP